MHMDLIAQMTPVLAVLDATNLVSQIQKFVGPLLLLGIGIVAIKHLVSRQMTQFFQFLALAVLILLLFYTPGVLLAITNVVTNFFGGTEVKSTTTGNTNIPG